jgi:hypothetical protein
MIGGKKSCYPLLLMDSNSKAHSEEADAKASSPVPAEGKNSVPVLYCPACALEVADPLTCGDCSAVICRVCGTPLESPEDLGIG